MRGSLDWVTRQVSYGVRGSAAGVVKIAGAASYLVSAILGPTRQLLAFFKLSVGSCPQRVKARLL